MTINNYLYIENGQIKHFEGVGNPPLRARLKDLRNTVIKCWEKCSQKHLADLGKQIDFINQKIDKHNENLTSGYFGWFFRLFTLEKIPRIQASVKIGGKIIEHKRRIHTELNQMVMNRDISLCVLSSGSSPKGQTVITYNPDWKKYFLIAGSEEGKVVRCYGTQISPRHAIELIKGKNSFVISDPNPMNPDKEIVIEVY